MLQGHVAGKNLMRCSHEGACCGDRFLGVFTQRVLSQGHVVISFSDWFIFRSVAGTCRMNSSHEATLRLTGCNVVLSPRHVPSIQTDLNSGDMSRGQNFDPQQDFS